MLDQIGKGISSPWSGEEGTEDDLFNKDRGFAPFNKDTWKRYASAGAQAALGAHALNKLFPGKKTVDHMADGIEIAGDLPSPISSPISGGPGIGTKIVGGALGLGAAYTLWKFFEKKRK